LASGERRVISGSTDWPQQQQQHNDQDGGGL
jgi:hypothetical protein